jgi:hypothetical protein
MTVVINTYNIDIRHLRFQHSSPTKSGANTARHQDRKLRKDLYLF